MTSGGWEAFVHLAYLDESGTDGHSPYVIFGAVVVPPGAFGRMEQFHDIAIQQLLQGEEVEKFTEFHASELYLGKGAFESVEEEKRFDAIRVLLTALESEGLSYIYGAVDRRKLAKSLVGTARPLDMAFRLCVLGIEDWARNQHPQYPGAIQLDFKDQYLLILDDNEQDKGELKRQLRATYRLLRWAHPYSRPKTETRLWHAHDDLYFGDSRDSVGIQMADLCNYFMSLHLQKIEGSEEFYEIFVGKTICAKPEPEWSEFRNFLVTHDSEPVVDSKNDAKSKGQTAQ